MEDNKPNTEQTTETPAETPTQAQTPPAETPKVVPYEQFLKVKEDAERRDALLREAQARLAKIEEERKAAEQKRLEEQGKYKDLADQYKAELDKLKAEKESLKSVVDNIREAQEREIEALIAKLPKDKADIIKAKLDKLADAGDRLDLLKIFIEQTTTVTPGRAAPGQGRTGGTQSNTLDEARKSGDIDGLLVALRK